MNIHLAHPFHYQAIRLDKHKKGVIGQCPITLLLFVRIFTLFPLMPQYLIVASQSQKQIHQME